MSYPLPEDRLVRFEHEEAHSCPGNSSHRCIECGEAFFCYACPDPKNLIYSQTTCKVCLDKLIGDAHYFRKWREMPEDKFADLIIELDSLLETMKDEGISKSEVIQEVNNVYYVYKE